MFRLLLVSIFFLFIQTFFFAQNIINSKLKVINSTVKSGISDSSLEEWGRKAVNMVNSKFNQTDANLTDVNQLDINLNKIENGVFKFDDGSLLYLDYEELTSNKLRYFLYENPIEKAFILIKDRKKCYIVKEDINEKRIHQFKLSGIFFDDDDFSNSRYSLNNFFEAIRGDYITEAIIKRKEIEEIYLPYEIIWKNYLFEIDSKTLLFKHNIEYNLKNEVVILNPFGGNYVIPSKTLLLWEKNTLKFKNTFGSVGFLNELLLVPNLYYVIENRKSMEVLSDKRLNISQELEDMIKINKDEIYTMLTSAEKENIINLAINTRITSDNNLKKNLSYDNGKIVLLNRFLLKEAYPDLCPAYLNLPEFDEKKTGDYTNDTDDKTKALLTERNMEGRIYIEENKIFKFPEIKESDAVNLSSTLYNEWKNALTKSLNLSGLIIFSLSVKGESEADNNKYYTIKDQSRFDENYYGIDFKDTLPFEYVFEALKNYCERGIESKVFNELNKKMESLLYKFAQYFKGAILFNNKIYRSNEIKKLSPVFLKIIYSGILSSKRDYINDEVWEIKTGLLKLDQDIYSLDFLLVEE